MKLNRIVLDIPMDRIVIADRHTIPYSPTQSGQHASIHVYKAQSYLLRASQKQVLLPGDFIELPISKDLPQDGILAIQPRSDNSTCEWPEPDITSSVNGVVRLVNTSYDPITIAKHQHIAQVHQTCDPADISSPPQISSNVKQSSYPSLSDRIALISIDPDNQLSNDDIRDFQDLHEKYAKVFSGKIGKYNDSKGKVRAYINMGPVEPPPQKARLPMYAKENMDLLQDKMDELEENGVLAKPEDLNIKVEYVSPSFLVNKPGGGHRLVTAFSNIGNYAKPTPSRITTSDEILQFLAQWQYVIKTDMTSQFFQLPMETASMKYLGTVTPYKGIRVYTRAAMGMPGSTEHLDQLTSRILGNLMREGVVMKIADDLYIGGDDISSLLYNWERVLQQFELSNLRLSPSKTVVCPITTTVLGWIWSAGSITVSQHKISPLATCDKPTTVKGLRSWCGAVKHIRCCIPQYSSLLTDLDMATAGKQSRDKILWSDKLTCAFGKAQKALLNPKTITIPRRSDLLVITSDGAVRNGGKGSVMYIMRNGKMLLGGYFSAKMKEFQKNWLPCEQEALAISTAIHHWGLVILQSKHETQVLTDSRPCIQAYEKLSRGEFSVSARVSSFMSSLSRYNVRLQHISGSANLPSDYLSRSPMECDERNCQICKFIEDNMEAAVYSVSIPEVISGHQTMPFLNNTSWKAVQQDCAALRRTYAHLSRGTRPGKKATNIKDVKRYLRVATFNRDGLLIKKESHPFRPTSQLIIVPRHILTGLLTALHLKFEHPVASQLQKVFSRYFYALDAEAEMKSITSNCVQCASLLRVPHEIMEFSTSAPQQMPGTTFACDVLCRAKQKILLIRDTFSSYTIARLIDNEQKVTIREAIIECTADIKSSGVASVRVDPASGMQALQNDPILQKHGLIVEVGRCKNKNKNPVAERAIQELEIELRKCYPNGNQLSPSELAVVVATLNSRIRNRGLSSKEIITQRDSITGEQLNFKDVHLGNKQHNLRLANHGPSSKAKGAGGAPASEINVSLGDLVYIKSDGNKHIARQRYIVTGFEKEYVIVKKLAGSQFRSKNYCLKRSEIYPVPSAAKLPLIVSQSRDSDSSDSDDIQTHPTTYVNPNAAISESDATSSDDGDPSDIDDPGGDIMHRRPPHDQTPPEPEHNDNQVIAGDVSRRGARERHPPKWMGDGQWETH